MPDRIISLRKILVATDFSVHAGTALAQAVALADRARAEITVAHVVTGAAWAVPATSFEAHWRIPPAEIKKAERHLRKEAEERLAEFVAVHRSPQRKLRLETLAGDPVVELIRAVQKKGYDLVVTGTRGLSTVKRLLVGSTAERLVRKCPCPVWVVKSEQGGLPRSLLAPVDFSAVSAKSLKLAALLAELFDAALHVVHVLDRVDEKARIPAVGANLDMQRWRREINRMTANHLLDFIGTHVPTRVVAKESLAVGTPWQRIGQIARRLDCGLIVMGSLGRTGIPGFLIGNTAEKVLRHSDRSILTVKPDDFVSPVPQG